MYSALAKVCSDAHHASAQWHGEAPVLADGAASLSKRGPLSTLIFITTSAGACLFSFCALHYSHRATRPGRPAVSSDFVPLLIALCGPHWELEAISIPVVIFTALVSGFSVSDCWQRIEKWVTVVKSPL